jgi:SAM-dependent methyltransferase
MINFFHFKKLPKDIWEIKKIFTDYHSSGNLIHDKKTDKLLGIATQITLADSRYPLEQTNYEPTSYNLIREFIKKFNLQENDIVYDLGSGYGRFIFYGAIVTQAKFIGVELIPERVSECLLIKQRFNLKNVEFINSDVKKVDFSDGDKFFLFNPFSDETRNYVFGKLNELAKRKKIEVITFHCSMEGYDSFKEILNNFDSKLHFYESI